MRFLMLLLASVVTTAGVAHAIRVAPPRVHFDLTQISVPKNEEATEDKARKVFDAVVAARADLVPAARKGVRSYKVTLKVDRIDRQVTPNPKEGAKGKVFTIKVSLQLVGTTQNDLLEFAGRGDSTVMTETGDNVRPRDMDNALDEAMREALGRALNEAVTELRSKKKN